MKEISIPKNMHEIIIRKQGERAIANNQKLLM